MNVPSLSRSLKRVYSTARPKKNTVISFVLAVRSMASKMHGNSHTRVERVCDVALATRRVRRSKGRALQPRCLLMSLTRQNRPGTPQNACGTSGACAVTHGAFKIRPVGLSASLLLWLSDTLVLLRRNSTSDAFKPRAPRGLSLTCGRPLSGSGTVSYTHLTLPTN